MSCAMILQVRLTPGACTEGIDRIEAGPGGWHAPAFPRARPPAGRQEHAALVVMLAKALGVPKSAVALPSGHRAG
jgi:uncharacterized protein YggU (UPF0235/DUF167 family)